MKNDKMASAYLSTTQAAHRLGLSVGTVQRMVESGVLQAYTTQGGHRRILTTSLNHYCRGALGTATGHPQVCVLSSPAHVTAELDALNLLDGLQVITNPLELAGIQDKVGVLFLDARIPWLPWADLHLADSLGTEAHCIIYNSAHLPENSQGALQAQATLYAGDVSADLVQGYLLGHAVVTRNAPPPALGVGAETATDLLIKRH
jgi:excisionase family DNA binding protein